MSLVVVTGMSGAGKSKAINTLEDLGYYCLDNLPVKLLSSVVGWMYNKDFSEKVAVTLDIRNRDISDSFFAALTAVEKSGIPVHVLFLDCEDSILIKRYKESRRLHPLMNLENQTDISGALKEERRVLSTVRETADYIIDMGPEGGDGGGTVVAQGTPEEVAAKGIGHTAPYLAKEL